MLLHNLEGRAATESMFKNVKAQSFTLYGRAAVVSSETCTCDPGLENPHTIARLGARCSTICEERTLETSVGDPMRGAGGVGGGGGGGGWGLGGGALTLEPPMYKVSG